MGKIQATVWLLTYKAEVKAVFSILLHTEQNKLLFISNNKIWFIKEMKLIY